MKHIKSFENIIKETPQVGDYVLVDESSLGDDAVTEFVNTHPAKIIKLTKYNHNIEYIVQFDNVPPDLDIKINNNALGKNTYPTTYTHGMRKIFQREIKYCAKTKEEIEIKMDQNKFNL